MATIVMDVNECDIAHEKLMLEEYGEEVMSAGWIPPRILKSRSKNGRSIAAVESDDGDELILSTALPQCP